MNITCYDYIIWDFNGTILDDAFICVEVLNRMLKKRNMPMVGLEQYAEKFGFPIFNYYETLGFNFKKESYDEIAQEFIDDYSANQHFCPLQEGVIEALEKIKAAGKHQSVLSASQQQKLEIGVKKLGIQNFFEHIVGLNDYYAVSKVDAGKKLLDNINAEPDKILLIGDTIHDYEVAEQMKIKCVLFPAGHQNITRLKSTGGKIIENLSRLELL